MIEAILRFSIRQRLFVVLFALLLVAGGIYSATRLPIDAVPDNDGIARDGRGRGSHQCAKRRIRRSGARVVPTGGDVVNHRISGTCDEMSCHD